MSMPLMLDPRSQHSVQGRGSPISNPLQNKGPGIAIKSNGICDQIQVDLIDYQNDPCKDHNGVLMRFLMVVKDHFTKFVWL